MNYIHYNRTELLNLIDQIKVWHSIVGHCHLEEFILNPLRTDNHRGSCSLVEYNGKIVLQDWASRQYSGQDCIAAYCLLNPQFSWEQVCYNLIEISQKGSLPSSYVIPGLALKPKEKTTQLIPIYRDWLIKDKKYWGQYGITKDQLTRNGLVEPICGYTQIKETKKSEHHFDELAYCYHYDERVKFYFPNRVDFRFLGNINRNDNYHIKRGSDTLLITKSLKDTLVFENLVDYDITHVQSENSDPDGHVILNWEIGYKHQIIVFDNDKSGLEGMQRLATKFLYTEPQLFWINPELGLKDISDMYKEYGEKDTLDYLNTYLC